MFLVASGIGGPRDISTVVECFHFTSLAGAGLLSTARPNKPSNAEAFCSNLPYSLWALLPKKDGREANCFGRALCEAASLLDVDLAKYTKRGGRLLWCPGTSS